MRSVLPLLAATLLAGAASSAFAAAQSTAAPSETTMPTEPSTQSVGPDQTAPSTTTQPMPSGTATSPTPSTATSAAPSTGATTSPNSTANAASSAGTNASATTAALSVGEPVNDNTGAQIGTISSLVGGASGQQMAVIKMGAKTFQVQADRLASVNGAATINLSQAQITSMLGASSQAAGGK